MQSRDSGHRRGVFSRGVFWISPNTTFPFPLYFLNNWAWESRCCGHKGGGGFFSGQVVTRVTTLHLDGLPYTTLRSDKECKGCLAGVCRSGVPLPTTLISATFRKGFGMSVWSLSQPSVWTRNTKGVYSIL